MLCWNKALWSARNSHGTWNSQSECFISAKHCYATLKIYANLGYFKNEFGVAFISLQRFSLPAMRYLTSFCIKLLVMLWQILLISHSKMRLWVFAIKYWYTFRVASSDESELNGTYRAAAIAQWYHLRLPSCGRGFESQAHHLCFFHLYYWNCNEIRTKINKKEAGKDPFF